jgi:DNA-directed RNA polymerase specialized sigma24 family protein
VQDALSFLPMCQLTELLGRVELANAEPRLAKVVEMRYFGGYSERQMAETLGVTERTVQREGEKARLILAAALD